MIPVERKGYVCGGILVVVIFVLAAANLLLGSVDIPAGAVWGALTGGTVENEAWSFIVWESRVPLCVTAWCCGAALAASGLMLQTVFNNPLADPSILGISSGASLGVALVMLAGGGMVSAGTFSFSGFLAVVAGAFAGAIGGGVARAAGGHREREHGGEGAGRDLTQVVHNVPFLNIIQTTVWGVGLGMRGIRAARESKKRNYAPNLS